MPSYRHLFGPVPSRRLGRSLGIDLVPHKICSFDCVFCQLGRTPATTLERKEYVDVGAVLDELRSWIDSGGTADFLTLAGGGEPTLHSRFGDVIAALGDMCEIPRVLLSNGSLFHLDAVRRGAAPAEVVKVSLSAWNQSCFEAVNRPHPGIAFGRVLDGLRRFRDMFSGSLWVEVFVVPGVNDSPEVVQRIASVVGGLRPARVHLNTAVRPAADPGVGAVSWKSLERLRGLFTPVAELAVSHGGHESAERSGGVDPNDIADIVTRHPATAEELGEILGLDSGRVEHMLAPLCRSGRIRTEERGDGVYYRVGENRGS